MKSSGWIKLIGILCIVFGAYRIMSAILELLLSTTNETFPEFLRPKFLIYMEILVNAIYVMAGIFFLMKKSFSLKLMYFALSFKIIFGSASLLFIRFPEFPVLNIAIGLINPLFNVFLLIGVFKLARYYYKSPEQMTEVPSNKIRNNILSQKVLKILSLTGILFLSVPLIIFILWIHSSNLATTQAESVSIFNSYFPEFLQGRFDTTYISLAFCILSIILAIICLRIPGKIWLILNVFVLTLCSLLLMLNLWSMM